MQLWNMCIEKWDLPEEITSWSSALLITLIVRFHLVTQEHISTDIPDSSRDYIRGKSKQDLQSHHFSEAKTYRYKGPTKPPMPKTDSKFQLSPLRVLVSA